MMTLKRAPSFLKQSGPKVEASSVKVYSNGKILRISNDLIDKLQPGLNVDFLDLVPFIGPKQTLVLKIAEKADFEGTVLRTWQSSPEAKSFLISLAGLLQSLGLTEKDSPGTYKAEVKDGTLIIHFAERL